jgi:hypothetical protein
VSITPLHFDLMSHDALDGLQGWEQDLGPWGEEPEREGENGGGL